MFVLINDDALAAIADLHCSDLFRQPTFRPCARSALLAAQCICVLAVACNAVFASEVVRGLRHRIDAVPRLHYRINAMPSERTVLQSLLASKSSFSFRHDERRARHTFDTPGNHKLSIAAGDRASGLTNCFQTRSA